MKKKYKKKKQQEKRREEDGNGVQEREERGRENWERKEVKKGERGKEKQGEEAEHNGRTLLKFSKKKKNFLSVSQDYPPLNNLFFFTAIQTIRVFLINSAIKITVIDLAG